MTDKISIKNRAAVQGHINTLTAQKTKLSTLADQARAEHAAVMAALAVTSGGSTAQASTSTAGAHADAAASKLSTATTGLQTWLDSLETIDDEGGAAVTGSGDTPSKPTDPKPTAPQAKPYSTSGGTTGGSSPYPAAK